MFNPQFHGRNLRKHRYSKNSHVYSITSCIKEREPVFSDFFLSRVLIQALKHQDNSGVTLTYAFVVMPDHFHWLFRLESGILEKVLHSVKSYTSHIAEQIVWQNGYHERAIKDEEDIKAISRYIVANPLRAGIVQDIGLYPHWDAIWLNGEI